ncbi:glycylpeptide N-tetradecanoyltransferase 2-like isoform X2 [Watersipora subatra]|uniref:glycylpeptide N-tetradecanoyltransferase 2-like isoform X2 n=1 Tax=Watersipora subatra TaxID=2589382 RepID=UPI00355BEAD4
MADADSLMDLGMSDGNNDISAGDDADGEEDGASLDGLTTGRHKKTHKKHKRKQQKELLVTTSESEDSSATCEKESSNPDTKSPPSTSSTADLVANKAISQGVEQNAQASLSSKEAQIQRSMEMVGKQLQSIQLSQKTAPKTMDDATKKKYQFWETQPVPKFDETVPLDINGPIDSDKPLDQLRQQPLSLPGAFEWDTLDITDASILTELYTLLNENYVEDDDNMFRFDYSPDFLKWALKPPGWCKDWHCGVRVVKSKKLVGFISAIPANIKIYDQTKPMVEINFLCVHKKLRSKRVAPVLIREITRRVNCKGLFQAVYTAGVVLPRPVASCRYWHRSLNPKKLIDVKFSHLGRNMTMQRTLKLYKLADKPQLPGFREFTKADLKVTYKLVNSYLDKFDLAAKFTEAEFEHWFIPRKGIIDSFVNEVNGEVKDFISFYALPSTIMHHPTYKTLKAAYAFYMASTSVSRTQLMNDALIIAKQLGFDVFNALDLMDNKEFLEKLKFGVGDGNLQYYIYNWKCPQMKADKVGLVLQ